MVNGPLVGNETTERLVLVALYSLVLALNIGLRIIKHYRNKRGDSD